MLSVIISILALCIACQMYAERASMSEQDAARSWHGVTFRHDRGQAGLTSAAISALSAMAAVVIMVD